MMIMFIPFIGYSIFLIPFAWVIGSMDKLASLRNLKTMKEKILNVYIFIPFGIPIMCIDLIADLYYFWSFNFRSNLKKQII